MRTATHPPPIGCHNDWVSVLVAGEMHCKTSGGTAPEESLCSFPFVYKGVQYNDCTTVDNVGKLWCSTQSHLTSRYDGSLWGNCQCAMGLDDATASYMDSSLQTVMAAYKPEDQTNDEHQPRQLPDTGDELPCTGVRYLSGECDVADLASTVKSAKESGLV